MDETSSSSSSAAASASATMKSTVIFYSNNPLDRANNKRTDPTYVSSLLENTTSLFVPFFKLRPLLTKPSSESKWHETHITSHCIASHHTYDEHRSGIDRRQVGWLSHPDALSLIKESSGASTSDSSNSNNTQTLLFLGTLNAVAYFALDVDESVANKLTEHKSNSLESDIREFPDMRFAAPALDYNDAAILAQVWNT